MTRKKTAKKSIETLTHEEASRKNIPTAEFQSVMRNDEQDPLRVAYERRNRDLDPQLVWRGKDEQDWSDLVVQAPPLYIQEKVHPKVLIDDLRKQSEAQKQAGNPQQLDLFADFNGLPDENAKTEFYQHDANWSNRMILGDSLQVMASLAEREGLRGKVQCIYLDPPYGIKFNSNFQWSTTSRDVKDGKVDHITREPEQVKAFRDTWRDGIHSYLTYLRDRLTVCRDLLTESGSIFVQIGDENVHIVRSLLEEVFGKQNFCCQIIYTTTSTQGSNLLPVINDNILWVAKDISRAKYRQIFARKILGGFGTTGYNQFQIRDNIIMPLSAINDLEKETKAGGKVFASSDLTSSHYSKSENISHYGREFTSKKRYWSTSTVGMCRLQKAGRLLIVGDTLRYKRFLKDFDVLPISNLWSEQLSEQNKSYVVQTASKVMERCILMSTDPSDLVLDPTCGSGTTAYVAEQWGRRWITIDTSRVALALARARIMGARYPYYLLADSRDGQLKEAEITRTVPSEAPTHNNIRQGFVYQRVPHITLKSIANNTEIDVIWENFQEKLAPIREQLSVASGQKKTLEEWEIPRERPVDWPQNTQPLLTAFWQQRIARQKEIDASIAAKADFEYLYDKPYEDKKKVRVAGPFTVESLSPHRVLAVDENDELIDPQQAGATPGDETDFVSMILENLKTAGVQQAHKQDKINFISLTPWPGHFICAEGRYMEGDQETGTEKRAAIFIGPEFGTVSRPDLVAAAREAGDAGFDALIACAFNYDAHSTDFDKLGRIPVLKARMNADLHMADDLKNTGKGNLFVIFGEPDISVVSGQWLVNRNGRIVANYDYVKELSGLGSLEEINRAGRDDLSHLGTVSTGRKVRDDQSDQASSSVSAGQHRGGSGTQRDKGVSSISGDSQRFPGGDRNLPDSSRETGHGFQGTDQPATGTGGRRRSDAQRTQTLAALKNLSESDFPLSLTTDHKSQVTIHGVDVFHPNTGEVRSDGAEGIACWFIDTDYNEESFFVRHAYFLGANDPYKALKTTLKAEINQEAWDTLHSDTSRPFDKPKSGRIAVKVINHLGDEVMKVFKVL
ncbi:modification methylase DpnIIB [bacterium BMS3Bbin14]|nr:modification methylase DpnIIB [bacterium BMS3Bbin14]